MSGKSNMASKKHHTEEERLEAIKVSKRKYQEKYRKINPDYVKNWIIDNKENIRKTSNQYRINKRKSDLLFKFSCDVRSLIGGSFRRRGCKKPIKTEQILGCSIKEFQNYIISKCPEGTTLENFNMYEYHIDHIIPLSSAKTEEEIIKLCHYTNLQPLWCKDNLMKSNKIEKINYVVLL
jgi:hypothetical protein